MNLPPRINDGKFDYVMVRPPGVEVGNDPNYEALFERVPPDPINQFIPDLDFQQGKTKVPLMRPLARGPKISPIKNE